MLKSMVADNIRRLVDKGGYKHKAIAERAGYTKQQFSCMLAGRKIITADDVIRIRAALGCTYEDIFYGPSQTE